MRWISVFVAAVLVSISGPVNIEAQTRRDQGASEISKSEPQRTALPDKSRAGFPSVNTSYVDENGVVHVTRVVPVPETVSPEARRLIGSQFWNDSKEDDHAQRNSAETQLKQQRALADSTEDRLAGEALVLYPVDVKRDVIAGVPVRVITPKNAGAENDGRVLINLHGGGFVADWGSLTESIPISSLTHTKVISVLYRLAPEHPFPAAVDDATAVYRELLKVYKPGSVGIYGTSAGAILTLETAANLRRLGVPLPGALGVFSGTGDLTRRGDTFSLFGLTGLAGPLDATREPILPEYVGTTDRRNPVLSPLLGDLSGFPPTLFVSSTRDMLLSDTALAQRAFLRAGVAAQLIVFEALQHGFWNDPKLPESREADGDIARFFDAHLAR
jgi:epsilon-lactone hydrolase